MKTEQSKTYRTVHEIAALAGISARTLHYYDQIGLLKPAKVNEAGYRFYDDRSLETLQEIMLLRELEFPLKEIKGIISDPGFDMRKALDSQMKLLEHQRDHLEELIRHVRRMKLQEEQKMDFSAYDKEKLEGYKKLAKEAWGETQAYKEYEQKAAKQSDVQERRAAEGLMNLFYEFGELKDKATGDEEVQAQVKKLQEYITANYYTCTKEILSCLGQMYCAGGEMTENIDVAGGKGCAQFVSEAINKYCS